MEVRRVNIINLMGRGFLLLNKKMQLELIGKEVTITWRCLG